MSRVDDGTTRLREAARTAEGITLFWGAALVGFSSSGSGKVEDPSEEVPPGRGPRFLQHGREACCRAAVLVGNVGGFAYTRAWRRTGREIASDLAELGFRVTLDTKATADDVYRALADRSLKVLVIIAHGENQKDLPNIYMNGDDKFRRTLSAGNIRKQILKAHGSTTHPCLEKVILESCFTGSKAKRPTFEKAFGVTGSALVAPLRGVNGLVSLTAYYAKQDYGVKPDPECEYAPEDNRA